MSTSYSYKHCWSRLARWIKMVAAKEEMSCDHPQRDSSQHIQSCLKDRSLQCDHDAQPRTDNSHSQ